jgi:hypothetical protein
MYKIITFPDFYRAFRDQEREGQFSLEAKLALFDYLKWCEADSGEMIKLDILALCRNYTEKTINTIIAENNLDASECLNDDDRYELVEDFLSKKTQIIWSDEDSFLFANF